jgi:DNA-directed RNA polymerase I subunit RPA1
MNRITMENSASPYQKMSFETTCQFLRKSSLYPIYYYIIFGLFSLTYSRFGDIDLLTSPSSRLTLGQPVKSGTGSFTCVADLTQWTPNKTLKVK